MNVSPSIVWFRQDLRLADNPALQAACAGDGKVLPVFILDDESPGPWRPGGASRWWLHHSLAALAADLETLGARLCLRRGRADAVLPALVAETGAEAVFWNRCYEPMAIERDKAIKSALRDRGLQVESFNGALLFEPWQIKTGQGGPYKVFTPFWKAVLAHPAPAAPAPAPTAIDGLPGIAGDSLEDWALTPNKPDWAGRWKSLWVPGEAGAAQRLSDFLDASAADYKDRRDHPAESGTSRLSPHLHWGEISPRQVWHAGQQAIAAGSARESGVMGFLRQLGWRDFSHLLLYHWPDFPDDPWKPEFAGFPWRDDEAAFAAWCRGRTGYPIVDAGMRELWQTGWMHNRLRMITASFLIKHLLIPWQRGEAWFWDTLVDADLANNAAGWQWVAGSGADASPYFRIFNPITQGEKFDPAGDYVRRWVPELAGLPDAYLNRPWDAPPEVLAAAGVTLGKIYPQPIVDHKAARQRALDGYEAMKQNT